MANVVSMWLNVLLFIFDKTDRILILNPVTIVTAEYMYLVYWLEIAVHSWHSRPHYGKMVYNDIVIMDEC